MSKNLENKRERFTVNDVRLRESTVNPGREMFVGYAAKWGTDSGLMVDPDIRDEGGRMVPFIEQIHPECFNRTLSVHPNVRALYDHNKSQILGTVNNGTLRLKVDEIGLYYECEINPNVSWARDAREVVLAGDIKGSSFRFERPKWKVDYQPGKPARATLMECFLIEVSPPVVFPAYADTEVSVGMREYVERYFKVPSSDSTPRLDRAQRLLRIGGEG